MCKWLIDKRLAKVHGLSIKPLPPLTPPCDQSFAYVFRVGKVELTWTTLQGGQVAISATVRNRSLSFLEECLVRYLQRRGIPEAALDMSRIAVVFVNDLNDAPINPKLYNVHGCPSPVEQRRHSKDRCDSSEERQNGEPTVLLSEKLSRFSQSCIAIVDPQDRLLDPDICFAVKKTPFIVITLGPLPFDTIRALFLCGTTVVVEFDEAAADDDIMQLITAITNGSDLMEILSSHQSYALSKEAWNTLGESEVPPTLWLHLEARSCFPERTFAHQLSVCSVNPTVRLY
ncbi:hypothetical protein COOONC_21845 [Cooperia oncophora]